MKAIKHNVSGLKLKERDFKLFELLFQYKIADASQIREFCYPTADITDVRRRLKKLERFKLLASRRLSEKSHTYKIFHLTKHGTKYLGKDYEGRLAKAKLKSDAPFHDLVLLNIGQLLSSKSVVEEYLTENLLQSEDSCHKDRFMRAFVVLNSDAFLRLVFQGERYNVAVEYERTAKHQKRYETLVDEYHAFSSVDAVFYFYESDKVKETIIRKEESKWQDNQPKFYFCRLEKGSALPPSLTFVDRTGDIILL